MSWQDIYQGQANSIAQQYGIPPQLFSNLITIESGWQPYAVSPKGAIGLGQLMPDTARQLNVNAWDPMDNLRGAASYLAAAFNRFHNWPQAIASYNPGSSVYTAEVLTGRNAQGQQVAPDISAQFTQPVSASSSAASSPASGTDFGNMIESALNWLFPGTTPVSSAQGKDLTQAETPGAVAGNVVAGLPSATGAGPGLLVGALAAAAAIAAIIVIVRQV